MDTGGIFWVPGMEAANVEEHEMSWPVLTLYRRQNRADAAGAGRYRSGVGAEEAWVLHGSDGLDVQIYTNESYVKCQGLLGGNPGGRAFFRVKQDSDVHARLAAGRIPQSLDEVSGEEMPLYWKGAPVALDGASVWTTNLPNFAGYGDPLDRDTRPRRAGSCRGQDDGSRGARGLRGGSGRDGEVDADKTVAERAERRRQRLGGGPVSGEAPTGAAAPAPGTRTGWRRSPSCSRGRGAHSVLINENLSLTRTAGGACYSCGCGHDLGPREANFKKACIVRESPVDAVGAGYASFDAEMMAKMCFREFFCPRCGARPATEVARVGDDYLWDIELRL